MINFSNKKIIITGATGGIGNELVKKFVSLKGKVLATGTNEEKLEKLKKNYPSIETIKFDISKHSEIESFIEQASSKLNGLDILVNNAGITLDNLSLRMKSDEWQKVIEINLTSTFFASKYALKKMLKNKFGRIVNISSIVGHTGNIGQANYTASKAGMIGWSKAMAAEVASRGITVNCIAPGFIATAMTDVLTDDQKERINNNIPMARMGAPDEIASAVVYLASDEAGYVTGQTIHVNGGMAMI